MNDERPEDHPAAKPVELTTIQRQAIRGLFTELGFSKGQGRPCDIRFVRGFMNRRAVDLRLVVFPTGETMERIDAILEANDVT